jgi:hypothetical protein
MKRDQSGTLDSLTTMAAEHRKSEAALTSEQAFAKVYTDPRNRELVAQCKAEERARRDAVTMAKGARSTIGDRVARLAAALAQQHKELTHDDAIQRVLARNPDLARAYQNELKT